jgi:hypothetical protein|uniref:Uncharacterized protein n=1 Tax=Sipha flava TaxID=143950 RepID=A0A2S2R9Z8_9HEMI
MSLDALRVNYFSRHNCSDARTRAPFAPSILDYRISNAFVTTANSSAHTVYPFDGYRADKNTRFRSRPPADKSKQRIIICFRDRAFIARKRARTTGCDAFLKIKTSRPIGACRLTPHVN